MVTSVCNIDIFTLEVPVRVRIKEKKYNEIAEYHREITTYKIAFPLQGIARRSVVTSTEGPRRLSPVECAVVDTNAKSLELLQKASSYWRCIIYDAPFDKSAVSAFSMLINGIVNAAAIDTWENEPSISRTLLQRAFIATPHIAGYSLEGKLRATQMAFAALRSHFDIRIEVPEVLLPPAPEPTSV